MSPKVLHPQALPMSPKVLLFTRFRPREEAKPLLLGGGEGACGGYPRRALLLQQRPRVEVIHGIDTHNAHKAWEPPAALHRRPQPEVVHGLPGPGHRLEHVREHRRGHQGVGGSVHVQYVVPRGEVLEEGLEGVEGVQHQGHAPPRDGLPPHEHHVALLRVLLAHCVVRRNIARRNILALQVHIDPRRTRVTVTGGDLQVVVHGVHKGACGASGDVQGVE
mmetsp:Transcript_24000/g.75144  ORF Transcript_24000/g.75144 Transcript_24000/m.75144 type:complete len:220 (+) Transcript_24000:334-993(+)